MLETYFARPQTVGRIRACWIGVEIERYAGWLSERGYSARTVRRHVQALVAFGEFARRRGASAVALADIARALATTDPDHAERIAQTIIGENWKVEALVAIVEAQKISAGSGPICASEPYNGRSPPYHIAAGRSIEVICAGRKADGG
jgi:hypothetical protein